MYACAALNRKGRDFPLSGRAPQPQPLCTLVEDGFGLRGGWASVRRRGCIAAVGGVRGAALGQVDTALGWHCERYAVYGWRMHVLLTWRLLT